MTSNSQTTPFLSTDSTDICLTGDRPTGKLHLGHFVGSIQNRIELQNIYETFILIADTQVLNNDITKAKDVKSNTIEVMKDYLSCGINPEKSTIFLQSEILELFELTNYLGNLVTLPQIQRIPTIKKENTTYNSQTTMGFLNYPISQCADIVLFDGTVVPVGIDQVPIIEFSNDLIQKFNFHFNTSIFRHINPKISENPKLTGIHGQEKMSKSLNNAIFISDDLSTVKNKVMQMYTDSNHIKISDPGKIEDNVVFSFLDAFHEDKSKLEELKEHYQKGGLGDVFLKKLLIKDLYNVLEPIQEKRNQLTDDYVLEVLNQGNLKAKIKAKERMNLIKNTIFS